MTFNPNWTISGITALDDDLSPALGGNLDPAGFDITTALDGGDNLVIYCGGTTGAAIPGSVTFKGGQVNPTSSQVTAGGATVLGGDNLRTSGSAGGGTLTLGGGDATASSSGIGGGVSLYAGDGGNIGGSLLFYVGKDTGDDGSPGHFDVHGPLSSDRAAEVRLFEGTNNGGNYIALDVPDSITTSRVWTLPVDDPTSVAGQFLTTDVSGVLAFAAALGDVVDDTTPTLGGNLDLAGHDLISPTGTNPLYVRMLAGQLSSGAGAAAYALIRGGAVAAAAAQLIAGYVTIQGGDHSGTSGEIEGGKINIIGGNASSSTDGDGGDIEIKAGTGGEAGGDILLRPGYDVTDHTSDGNVILQPVASGQLVELQFREDSANGTEYIGLSAPSSVATSRVWQLPDDDPSVAADRFLTTDSSGVLSFSDAIQTATLQTSDGATYDLLAIAVPSGSTVTVEFTVAAYDSTNNEGGSVRLGSVSAVNVGGTTTQIAQSVSTDGLAASSGTVTAVVDDATDTIDIRVAGAGSTTIDWKVQARVVTM